MHKAYGQHLILDAYGCDERRLQSTDVIYDFLDNLPSRIGMEKIGPPQLAKFDDPEKAGVTGIIMIVTSHISIHTYSLKQCFFMDVFSCKEFDSIEVVRHTKEVFQAEHIQFHEFPRGDQFPAENLVTFRPDA